MLIESTECIHPNQSTLNHIHYDVGKKKKARTNSLHNTRTSQKESKIILLRLLSLILNKILENWSSPVLSFLFRFFSLGKLRGDTKALKMFEKEIVGPFTIINFYFDIM